MSERIGQERKSPPIEGLDGLLDRGARGDGLAESHLDVRDHKVE